jgi:hypothetical protein
MNWLKQAQNIKHAETKGVNPHVEWIRSLPESIIEQLREIMKAPNSGERAEKLWNLFKKAADEGSISYNEFVPDYQAAQQTVGLIFHLAFPEKTNGAQEKQFRHLKRWKTPRNYYGESWEGWWAAPVGRSRDSNILEESNWIVQLERIPESETVQVVRESHWAAGWVEWLAIHESDRGALAEAEEVGNKLENYPILDEDHYLELEWKTMEASDNLYDEKTGEWRYVIEGEWEGRLEGIDTGWEEMTASGTFFITYKATKRSLVVTGVKPIDMDIKHPEFERKVVSNGDDKFTPFKKVVNDEILRLGKNPCEHKIFEQMCKDVLEKHSMY